LDEEDEEKKREKEEKGGNFPAPVLAGIVSGIFLASVVRLHRAWAGRFQVE